MGKKRNWNIGIRVCVVFIFTGKGRVRWVYVLRFICYIRICFSFIGRCYFFFKGLEVER